MNKSYSIDKGYTLKSKKIRIVYIYDCLARMGGLERVLTDKMNYLADKLGYEVYVVTSCQGKHPFIFPLSTKISHIDINVNPSAKYKYINPLRLYIAWKIKRRLKNRLQEVVNTINPDIIIGTNYYEPVIISSLKTSAEIVIESHVSEFAYLKTEMNKTTIRDFVMRYLQRKKINKLKKLCAHLVALTKGDAKDWNMDEKRMTVIPNPITRESLLSSTCLPHRVISAGRLEPQKGFDMMIDAWAKVYSQHKDWHLYIFGEGSMEKNLGSQISELGLEKTIHIMPFTHDIYEEYLKSSIYVLSSRYEGFGLVLIEAMECGVPCVAFDCDHGPSDIIKDKEDGLLVENGNVEALADAICWMIEHESERKAMGRKAKENVQRYNIDVVMEQWQTFFNTILEEN